ncbi:hypothetical protein BFP72_18635 [Reichenbachiella sp. 5M10]|uniref:Kelch repeat-containing protein n=1 Tax=Reichenbachiella sp. 5M10 TaxID=1889772 RepID=UPI000C15A40B|nr:T9SS type A sorting domain-containing protein [Reichenbachiella sp. 5M10]PIB37282.1 hypothetical protein BFP72_18635 [Reichenbachiella sp. 5M10]
MSRSFTLTTEGTVTSGVRYLFCFLFFLSTSWSAYSQTFPYSEDFNTDDGGWVASGTASSWEWGVMASGKTGWATNLSGNYNNDELSYLESPSLDLSGVMTNMILKFGLTFDLESGWDRSWLESSIDGGTTYTRIVEEDLEYVSSSSWTGSGVNVTAVTYAISALAGEADVRFRFVLDSDVSVTRVGGELDYFEVVGPEEHELEVYSIDAIDPSAVLQDESITVNLRNRGSTTETSIPLTVWVDGPSGREEFSETVSTSLVNEGILAHTFTSEMGFSEVGNYDITVFSTLEGDLRLDNDTASIRVIKRAVYTSGLPYSTDFNDLLTVTYTSDQGEIDGLPGWSFNSTHENGSLGIGVFANNTDRALELSRHIDGEFVSNSAVLTLDMSDKAVATDDVLLDFRFSKYSSSNYAENRIHVRGDESSEWIELYNWYANQGADNEWIQAEALSITGALVANGQEFSSSVQIRFGEREDYASDAFRLDDVRVYERSAHEVSSVSLTIPASSSQLTSSESVTVNYINLGATTETSIPLTVWVDGPNGRQEVSESAVGSWATEETMTYAFATALDFSAVGNYEVTVFSTLTGDLIQSNDTLRSKTTKKSVYSGGLPYSTDFNDLLTVTYTSDQGEIDGLPGWSFNSTHENGSLGIGVFANNTDRALELSRHIDGEFVSNSAVLTLDMSDKAVATDDVLLDFRFSKYSSSNYAENRIHVRGDESSEWIELYNWYANQGAENEWIQAEVLSITGALVANGQEFSSSFQIRFGEKEDYASDAFRLDDVRVYERSAHEVSSVSLTIPASSSQLTSSETVTVEYVNRGATTETSIPLTVWVDGPNGRQEVSESAVGSWATEETLTYAFATALDFSAVGNYEVTVFSTLTGDLIQSNDTLRSKTTKKSVYSGGLPYVADFEDVSDAVYTRDQGELVGLQGWSFETSAPNGQLKLGTFTNNSTRAMELARSVNGDYTTNYAVLTMDLSGHSASVDDILLDFQFSQYNPSNYDENRVYIRGSESDDWVLLYDWYANRANTSVWVNVEGLAIADSLVSNGQDFSSSFQIRFGEREYYASDAFRLDDLRVYERPAHEVDAVSIALPASSSQLTASETVTVEYVNRGATTETSIPLTVWVDGPNGRQEVSESATGSWATGDTVTYAFATALDFSVGGNYEVAVFSVLTGDPMQENDTLRSTMMKPSVYRGQLPYAVDFESLVDTAYFVNQGELYGLEGWSYTNDGANGRVVLGPTINNDGRVLGLSRSSSYPIASNNAVLTMDLSTLSATTDDVLMDFRYSQRNASDYDENQIFVRGDESSEWVVLYDWYANGGADNEWVNVSGQAISDSLVAHGQDFSASFQLRFGERGYFNTDAFRLDDLRVYLREAHDLRTVQLDIPEASALLTKTESITAHIINQGSTTETSIPLVAWIDGPDGRQTVSETATGSWATNDTLSYTFNTAIDLDALGVYEVTVFSGLTTDLIPSNDTLRSETMKRSQYTGGLPYVVDFEAIQDTVYMGKQGELVGLDGWSYEPQTEAGRLSIGQYGGNATQSLKLFRETSLVTSNFADITMDMSAYAVASDDIFLDFRFSKLYSDNYFANRVYIRGSESDEWIEFYNWFENSASNYEWIDVSTLLITDSLEVHGQDFSSTFQLRFGERDTYNSRSLFIDDIRVYERPAHELVAVEMILPQASPVLTDQETVSVKFVNFGTNTETSIPLTAWVDGPSGRQEVSATATVSLVTGDTLTYSFVTGFDFSEAGRYEGTAFGTLTGDLLAINDTVRAATIQQSTYSSGLPYSMDFEDVTPVSYYDQQGMLEGLEGWSYVSDIEGGLLEIGSFTNSEGQALELSRSLEGDFVTNDAFLTMDLSSYSVATDEILLDFSYSVYSPANYENNRVFVRGDASSEWIAMYNWYTYHPSNNVWSEVLNLAISDSLQAHGQDFTSTFQIRFGEREDYASDNFRLDDVKVYLRPTHDVRTVAVTIPSYSASLTDSETITIEYINVGVETETSVPLTAWLDGPEGRQVVTETATAAVATGETGEYTFTAGFDFSTEGSYVLTVFSAVDEDTNFLNDTVRNETLRQSVYTQGLPYVADFEEVEPVDYVGAQWGSLAGLEGWSFLSSSPNTRLSIGVYGENSSQSLWVNQTQYQGNGKDAILTLDLSDRSVTTDDLLLDFRFSDLDSYLYSGSSVYVRGSESEDWIEIYDWYDYRLGSEEWVDVSGLTLSDFLQSNGQEYSSTFQVRFYVYNYYSNEGMAIDNVKVYESPLSEGRAGAVAASAGDVAYFGLGYNEDSYFQDFWKTDQLGEITVPLADFPGAARSAAVSFVIDDKVYVGTGRDESGTYLADFYVYDPTTDTWTQLGDFDGGARTDAVAFSIGSSGYIGTGMSETDEQSDFWKYTPSTDSWTQLTDWGADKRRGAFAFVIDDKAYVGGGSYFDSFSFQLSDIQEFDPTTELWTEKIFADGLNLSANYAATFTSFGKGYIAYGSKSNLVSYDPVTNEVENLGDLLEMGGVRNRPIAFSVGDQAYVGLGYSGVFDVVYSNEVVAVQGLKIEPIDILLSNTTLVENDYSQRVGSLYAEDPMDGRAHTFELVAGDGVNDASNSRFTIANGYLYTQSYFDFETETTANVYLKATDADGLSIEKAFVLSVEDANDIPSGIILSSTEVYESLTGETVSVGTLTALDDDLGDTHTFEIRTVDSPFVIEGNELKIVAPDYETQDSYGISVRVTDQDGSFNTEYIYIDVLNVNEAPTALSFDTDSFDEDLEAGDWIGSFVVTDPDVGDQYSYEFIESDQFGSNNSAFRIEGNDLYLVTPFSYETQNVAFAFVRLTDEDGNILETAVSLDILDVNEAPTSITFTSSVEPTASIIKANTVIGQIEVEDEDIDDAHTIVITNAWFELSVDDQGQVTALEDMDFSGIANLEFTATATDLGGASMSQFFMISRGELVLKTEDPAISFEMYPNPVSSNLMVESLQADRVEVYSLTGVRLLEQTINGTQATIDFSHMPVGVYLLKVYEGKSFSTHRVIKQ